jgi:hypothetical protein
MLENIVPVVLLATAALVVAGNWTAVAWSLRLKSRGIERHISTVPLLAQILAFLAAAVASQSVSPILPAWSYWVVTCSDIALYSMLLVPVYLLRSRFRART